MSSIQTKEKVEILIQKIDEMFSKCHEEILLADCDDFNPSYFEIGGYENIVETFYTQIENIFELIQKEYKPDKFLSGDFYHKDLLNFISTLEIEGDKVISYSVYEELREYLMARHKFRHTSFVCLNWEQMKPLLSGIKPLWERVKKDINDFLTKN